MKGIRIVKHYVCSTCGGCFFDDRPAARDCCNEKSEDKRECQFCKKKEVVFDGEDESGHLNYYCKSCGEPQDD